MGRRVAIERPRWVTKVRAMKLIVDQLSGTLFRFAMIVYGLRRREGRVILFFLGFWGKSWENVLSV